MLIVVISPSFPRFDATTHYWQAEFASVVGFLRRAIPWRRRRFGPRRPGLCTGSWSWSASCWSGRTSWLSGPGCGRPRRPGSWGNPDPRDQPRDAGSWSGAMVRCGCPSITAASRSTAS